MIPANPLGTAGERFGFGTRVTLPILTISVMLLTRDFLGSFCSQEKQKTLLVNIKVFIMPISQELILKRLEA